MLRFLLSAVLVFLKLAAVSAQATVNQISSADSEMQLAYEALGKEQPDSLHLHLQKARIFYLQNQQWNKYDTSFIEFAKVLFTKWSTDIKYVETGIESLKALREDIQQQFGVSTDRETEICYQIARGYYYKGLSWKNLNQITAANLSFDSCAIYIHDNLAQLVQLPPEKTALTRANHRNILGASFTAKGEGALAVVELEQVLAIRIAQLGPEADLVASAYYNMGNAYLNLELYNKALDAYTKSIKIREKLWGANNFRLANMYFNAGVIYENKEEYDNAILFYNRAKDLYEKNMPDFNNAEQLINQVCAYLAICYQQKGAYQESSLYHQRSIQTYEKSSSEVDNTVKIAEYYANQAVLASLKGDYKEAISLNEKALQVYQQKLDPTDFRLIKTRNNLGNAYADNGQYDLALIELQGAIQSIANDPKQQEQYASLISDLGLIYFYQGNFKEAKNYNLKALEILQKIFTGKSYKIAIIYNNLARIAEKENNLQQALQYVQQALAANHKDFTGENVTAIPAAKGYFQYNYFVESLLLKTDFLRKDSNADALFAARSIYLVADSVLKQVQNELLSSEDKIRLSEKIYEVSQGAIENCVHLAETTGDARFYEEAFIYTEKSKNTVLTQSITANHAKHFAGIPDTLLALEDRLQSDIRYYSLKLSEQPDSASRNLYQNELFSAQKLYRTLIQELEEEFPLYHQLKYDRSVPSVSAIQSVLPANTALVSYFVGDSTLYSFVITKKNFKVYRFPIGKDFYNQQIGIRKSITWQLNEDYVALAHRLYQQLFPFTLDKAIESLIIIPDGTLSKLPFEALLTQKVNPRSAINFSQLPYLLNDYQISYALSGALFYQDRFSPPAADKTNGGLLAYAPVFAEPQKVGFYSNGTRNPLAEVNGDIGRTTTSDGQYVAALPATADEVQSIAAVFQQKGQQTSTFLFQNANENQLKRSDMSHSKYIHIATHGFINEAQPDLSGLLLFPDSTEQEDHILYSGEVYGLNLNAQLVVLSACETGLGKVANGEGLLGLSRAFFYAGAENLLVSLWKVQDQATADLMVGFYQAHLNGDAAQFSTPLRQAKLDLIRSNNFNHPYYWSAFVLIGR